MSNEEARRAEREARHDVDTSGRKTRHEDAITRYLAAFAYREKREEQRDHARKPDGEPADR
jgi:hypothetical protein